MNFNLNEEIIDGHLVTEEDKKLWAVEMDLAEKLLNVCKKHDLKIWAEGGTLLGAVRHKGFIPWDNDMDFVMMRDDYEKLIELGPKEFKEPYFLQTLYNDNVFSGLVKLRRTDTAMIDTWYEQWKPRHYGIFIDVIVMDAVPDNQDLFLKQCDKIRYWERLFTRKHVLRSDYSSLRSFFRSLYVDAFFAKDGGVINSQRKLVNMLRKNQNQSHDCCGKVEVNLQWRKDKKVELRKCAWYNDTIELPFLDMTLPAPKEYDKVLTSQFGNYMVPIKGASCHDILITKTDKSYKEVLNELTK